MVDLETKFLYKPAFFLTTALICSWIMACARYAPDGISAIETAVAADVIFLALNQTAIGKLDKPPVLVGKFIGFGLMLGVMSLFMEGQFIDFGRYF